MLFQVTSPSHNSDWWLDTCATCLVCSNKDLFFTYIAAKKNVLMDDRSTVVVLGTRITLKNVKHVPSISKYLVSGSLLCNAGMRLDFQGRKIVLSCKKIYFCNAYRTYGMYNISSTIPNSVINNISTSAYSSTL